MKEKIIIVIMLLIFLSLMGRFFLKNEDGEKKETLYKIEFESLDELAVFVTLENEVCRNQAGISSLMEENIWDMDIRASVIAGEGKVGVGTDGDISREPDYVHLYSNLYSVPRTEWTKREEGQKICYLTFDDGPSQNTLKVLDALDDAGIKATFFVIGEEVAQSEENKEILKEVVNRGHLVGLHTYCHNYKKIYSSVNAFLADYEKVFNLIEEVTGERPFIYRFPGGSYNPYTKRIRKELVAEMERRGFIYYDWNVSGEDSVGTPTSYSVNRNINKDLKRYQAPVVLLHDGYINKLTCKILPGIIKSIKDKGYDFDRLDNREPCQFRW